MSGGLIHTTKMVNILSMPAYIFSDNSISLASKGIFAQIFYSKDNILSISDIANYTSDTEDIIINCINELVDHGYINKNAKGEFVIKNKVSTSKSKNENIEELKTSIKETTVAPNVKKNKFEFVKDKVNECDLPDTVKTLLIDYFYKWLKGEDRFEGQVLHKNMVDGRINSFLDIKNTYSLTQSEMEQCVKQSIDNHWFKFIWPLVKRSNQFDKSTLVSGSYTQNEIEEIKRKAKQRLEENSDE